MMHNQADLALDAFLVQMSEQKKSQKKRVRHSAWERQGTPAAYPLTLDKLQALPSVLTAPAAADPGLHTCLPLRDGFKQSLQFPR